MQKFGRSFALRDPSDTCLTVHWLLKPFIINKRQYNFRAQYESSLILRILSDFQATNA